MASSLFGFAGVVLFAGGVLVLILIEGIPCEADGIPTEQFAVQWRDGTTTNASSLFDWKFEEKLFGRGLPTNIDEATIMGRRLFDPSNFAHSLRNTRVKSNLIGSYIEFANGDILPGTIVSSQNDPNNSERAADRFHKLDRPSYISVVVSNPLAMVSRNNTLRIRTDSIRRIVFTQPSSQPYVPGLVVYRDDQKEIAKQMKWTPDGLRLLLDRTVKFVTWDQLAEFHVPHPAVFDTILRDSMVPPKSDLDILGRLSTRAGATLTYHCDRVFSTKVRWTYYHLVQPAWADTGILVPIDDIYSVDYRRANEVPLSLLPGRALAERSLLGVTRPWRRNNDVQGQPLSIGGRTVAMGIGTHSYSEIQFDLPPRSLTFSCEVGIDDVVGRGGCVRCKLFADDIDGQPIWTSDIIRGNDDPVPVQVNDLQGASHLILVTEFGHDQRPSGADPLDIRDVVSWQNTTITVELPERKLEEFELPEIIPELRGWSVSASMKERIVTKPRYVMKEGRWAHTMKLTPSSPDNPTEPFEFTREVDVDINNAWLIASSGRDENGPIGYRVTVYANGDKIPGTEGYDGNTTGYAPGDYDKVLYSLGKFHGKKVTVKVLATPARNDPANLAGLVWDELTLNPIIQGLPQNGNPIEPDVEIETLESLKILPAKNPQATDENATVQTDLPITLRWFPIASGLRIEPTVDSVTCKLDPTYKRFVACIGPAGQSRGAIQSFQVLIDDELLWESGRFTRMSQAQQIDIPLPTDKNPKHITLRVINETSNHAVWGNAGFMLK
jgi:hypothetical protein